MPATCRNPPERNRVRTLPQATPHRAGNALPNLAGPVVGLYVHVPFCTHKCHYCDFYSITRQTPDRMHAFVDRILKEADVWLARGVQTNFKTIFFGGGTPSLLPRDAMTRLLIGLADRFDLRDVNEWTVEVNPATADHADLAAMRAGGVTRISLGGQSFEPSELATLERQHDPADVGRAVNLARDVGIDRQSIDLIFAIPGQTLASLNCSLDLTLATGVTHLSCYGLTYEPNTPLAVRRRLGRIVATPDDEEVRQFRHVRERLAAAGRPAYEISNYAAPGDACRHNLTYWHGDSYLGLGPSAASHVAGVRWRNEPHLGRWEKAVDAGEPAAIEVEQLDADARARELAWLNLRTTRGIDVTDFQRRTGLNPRQRFATVLASLTGAGLIDDAGDRLHLSKSAWPLADGVAAEFLADLS